MKRRGFLSFLSLSPMLATATIASARPHRNVSVEALLENVPGGITVANVRLDNVKFVLNKRWLVARGGHEKS